MIDCTTFENSEIDLLYGELDDDAAAAMAAHASTCSSCAARIERLRGTRGLVRSVALEPVADDFESRIMAAVDAGVVKKAAPAPDASVGGQKAGGGAKILRFMARPSFAVAASFVLVLGLAALMVTRNTAPSLSSLAESDQGPAAKAAPAEPAASGFFAAGVAPAATAVPPAIADEQRAKTGVLSQAQSPAAAAPMPPRPTRREGEPVTASKDGDPALATAKSLYAQGRYAEALPRFEALKATSPEAALYAARCVERTEGCAAAATSFASIAEDNPGTQIGGMAGREASRCTEVAGRAAGAGGGAHASPKAAARPAAGKPAAPAATSTTTK